MFLRPRLFSVRHSGLPIAGMIFILGLIGGAMLSGAIGPATTAIAPVEQANSYPANISESRLPADVIRVVDGDTFEARVHVWPGIEITTKVRLRGIDAPEMSAQCRDEAAKAEASRAALQAILAQGGVSLAKVAPDKYGGRVVAEAATRITANVSSAMLDAGHARRYSGGRRESWCG
jgi:endonuclease YncB( thermonuclease family)